MESGCIKVLVILFILIEICITTCVMAELKNKALNPSTTPAHNVNTDYDPELQLAKLFYFIAHLPKWCFGILGLGPSSAGHHFHETENNVSVQEEEMVDVEIAPDSDDASSAAYNVFWPIKLTLLNGLIETLFTHYPATLNVGPIEQDMSVISIVLISTFIACLTSLLIIFLHNLFAEKAVAVHSLNENIPVVKKHRRSRSYSRTAFSLPTNPSQYSPNHEKFEDCLGNSSDLQDFPETDHREGTNKPGNGTSDEPMAVILHQFSRGKYSPCFDMQGMRVETLLRLAGIQYEVQFDCNNTGPYIQIGEEIIWGYHCISKYLHSNFHEQFSSLQVPPELRIQSHFIILHVEHEISWLLYHWRWFYGISCREDNFAWNKVPDKYVELAAASWNRKFGNVKIDCIVQYLDDALNILSRILGENQYFVHNTVSEVDVCVFAILSQALWAMPTTTIEGIVFTKRNLVSFANRIRNLCWRDWDGHLCTKPAMNKDSCTPPCNKEEEVRTSTESHNLGPHRPRRTRTRIFKHATIPFYCPPDIQATTGDVPGVDNERHDLKKDYAHDLNIGFHEEFSEQTGTSRLEKETTISINSPDSHEQLVEASESMKINEMLNTTFLVDDSQTQSCNYSNLCDNFSIIDKDSLKKQLFDVPTNQVVKITNNDKSASELGRWNVVESEKHSSLEEILPSQEHAQGDQELHPLSPMQLSQSAYRSRSCNQTPMRSKIPVRRTSGTMSIRRCGYTRNSL